MQLTITDDFDLRKIADSGQCFRIRNFDDRGYRFISGDRVLYLTQPVSGNFRVSCSQEEWDSYWTEYFDLNRNYEQVRESAKDDVYINSAANTGKGIRILRQDPWEILITFIISQRKSIPAIKKCVELLSEKYGTPIQTEYELLYAFPRPEQLLSADSASLAECGLGYRLPYVEDAVQKVASRTLDLDALSLLDDDSLVQALMSVSGVGVKVSNCVGLFAYGRTACAPVDTWIAKTIAANYHGENPFPKYGENAGIMQQYVFYYAQTHKNNGGHIDV